MAVLRFRLRLAWNWDSALTATQEKHRDFGEVKRAWKALIL
jgi:hypothetical protein